MFKVPNRSFHIVERLRTGVKYTQVKKARTKPALLNVEICDFMTGLVVLLA